MAMRVVVDLVELRNQAELLGEVYLQLVQDSGKWDVAVDIKDGAREVGKHVRAALKAAHPTLDLIALEEEYLEAFFSVKRHLQAQSAAAGARMLQAQVQTLTEFRSKIGKGDTPAAISLIATGVRRRLGGEFTPSVHEKALAELLFGPPEKPSTSLPDKNPEPNPSYQRGLQKVFRHSVRAALRVELQAFAETLALEPRAAQRYSSDRGRRPLQDLVGPPGLR